MKIQHEADFFKFSAFHEGTKENMILWDMQNISDILL